ncbi:conserved hypothetical protein [Pedosphaera parvula Ellin514]|uniref:Uncharacterized protein n=2 Tax=Pedosphaera TaxID=1032526 RepID=B9XS92_PEDPL|nr:conserved hypothetical protein [Pedosphaera parvula Ellin514]
MVSLLPLIIGASFGGPMWAIMTLLFLRGEGGMVKATAFAVGAMIVRVLQGILFGYVFISAVRAGGEVGANFMASTMLLMVGVLLLATVIKTLCKEEDPDAPPPKWMTALDGITALTACGMGALLMLIGMKQWIFTLSAIAVIDEAQLGLTASIFAYLFFAVAAQALVLAPIISRAVAPKQSARVLELLLAWLERRSRAITIVASLIFGVWFITKGVTGLMGHGAETAITNTHK